MSSFIHITNALIYDSEERETDHMKQVILIDSQIRNHSEIMASVNSETFPILYSTTSERNDLRALLQDKFMKIERLGIFMEMESEKMFLNLEPFFAKSETCPYSKNVRFLMEIMEEFSIAHLDFIFADGMCPMVTKEWKTYFDILSKEGQIGFENSVYFILDFPLQQYLKPILKPWLSGFSLPCSMAVHGEHLYVANFGSSFVSRVTLCEGNVRRVSDDIGMELEWKAFEEPAGLVVHGKYLYVSNYCEENGYISKINLQTMEVQARWFEDLLGPVGLTVWEDNLYICDSLDNKIVRVNIYNPHDTSEWISLESPVAAVCYGGFMYVSCMREDCIRKISLSCGGGVGAGAGAGKIMDQWEIGNPVSMAVSQKGLMYISCLYDACSDAGNLIYVLDLVSGNFVENLDISYNGVGSLMVHGGDLYLAEYLSFGLRKFPLPLVVDLLEEELAREERERERMAQMEREKREQMAQMEREKRERERHERERCESELRRKREEREREYERGCEYERAQRRARRELEEQELRERREEYEREQREIQELRQKREERQREYEREQRELQELRIKCQQEYEREQRELQELRQKREEREREYEREEQARREEQERREFQARREKWAEMLETHPFIPTLETMAVSSELADMASSSELAVSSDMVVSSDMASESLKTKFIPLKNTIRMSGLYSLRGLPNEDESVDADSNLRRSKKQFSSVGGFTYTGMEKPIQKMGMKHF